MKFDGYFVLVHLLELPNLAVDAKRFLASLCSRIILGLSVPDPSRDSHHRWLIRVYAFLSFGWRLLVAASLLIVASMLFHGAGICLLYTSPSPRD